MIVLLVLTLCWIHYFAFKLSFQCHFCCSVTGNLVLKHHCLKKFKIKIEVYLCACHWIDHPLGLKSLESLGNANTKDRELSKEENSVSEGLQELGRWENNRDGLCNEEGECPK